MKLPTSLALLLSLFFLAGCESLSEPRVGMSEKNWLRGAVLADVTYTEGKVNAYRSNRLYYYFLKGVLVKIDDRWISAQEIEHPDESRKNGSVPEAGSEAQKK